MHPMEGAGPDPKLELLEGFRSSRASTRRACRRGRHHRGTDVDAGTTLTTEGRQEGYYAIAGGSVRIDRGGRTINTLHDGDFLERCPPGWRSADSDGRPRRLATAVMNHGGSGSSQPGPGRREAILEELAAPSPARRRGPALVRKLVSEAGCP